ncbi:hypothetical protein AX279_01165 [Pseudomonas sp. J237]|nr:hypothetical protein AX279_01165 [Pseudomonas sp. J237]
MAQLRVYPIAVVCRFRMMRKSINGCTSTLESVAADYLPLSEMVMTDCPGAGLSILRRLSLVDQRHFAGIKKAII